MIQGAGSSADDTKRAIIPSPEERARFASNSASGWGRGVASSSEWSAVVGAAASLSEVGCGGGGGIIERMGRSRCVDDWMGGDRRVVGRVGCDFDGLGLGVSC